ncbi:MAG: glutamate-5-semialdehyde dehydrogenase [Gammaproteobacteria bacterium]|nr:glutamate-5-semialdehyde dehydrogenase [Gammaproteobacteria bacterium]MYD77086.1 glutamate-5-semialdehyde dehydrogenase [Gammaproteobacteria bacterium]MYJ51482.1 glutamate-5-semialdehyde dehydrogenase [Gammaproteobacteria bacterium]
MGTNTAARFDVVEYMDRMGRKARAVSSDIARLGPDVKNRALECIAQSIEKGADTILAENALDMSAARRNNLKSSLVDRLMLDESRIAATVQGCRQVAGLKDPVGEMTEPVRRPSGIEISKMRVPLGVVGIIYESRPNVTVDAAVLCFKSGNACILRGGSEAIHSNLALARCMKAGLEDAGLDPDCIQVVETTDRTAVDCLITMDEHVDIIVPRGGKGLIERISKHATVPVIKHLDGICHVYIDSEADVEKAIRVAYNAKARRYGICGAMETLLVADDIAPDVLPELCRQYRDKGIELRGCGRARQLVDGMAPATDEDWATEYLDAILSIRVVEGMNQAIEHIEAYGSGHTDSIITENPQRQREFASRVDSSSVMINASTQFADGFEYGLGAEIGISTDKLHVRGPVGLEGLTSQKYVVRGDGAIRP